MSKKVLIISSSPREGANSDLLCDAFKRGAQAAGHSVDKVRLVEQDINYCTGCCHCISAPGTCVQADDMPGLFGKLIDANVLVLATPVYFRSMNGHMKTFIDRVCPIYTEVRDMDVYFIVSAAGGTFPVNSTVESLRTFTGCLGGIREKGVISSTGRWDAGQVQGTKVAEQAFESGRNA